jgi:predicted RNase H-like HicB family nuclease
LKKIAFTMVIERNGEGILTATVLSLRGCHTQAKSMPKLLERTKAAIDLCLDVEWA